MYFDMKSPEEVGLSSRGILNFIFDMEKQGIELHSLMIVRHGKCCYANWWEPYAPEYPHPIYSFSKTLTALAIGFAEQEGLLSLDEKIVDLFPHQLPKDPSPNLKEVNLHHLLTMSCGQETEIINRSAYWLECFLAHPFPHKPGTFYKYNTAGTNVLSAVLKEKTGQNVTEFLRPRLLDPLGIHSISCAVLPDGVENGGGGMKLTTEDMAKVAFFLLHRGSWEGRQLLNTSWFDRACSKQIETAGDSEGHIKEWANGYGYQCWMGSIPGSFRADGAYGQFGFVYPSLDMIILTTCATEQTQSLVDSMLEHIVSQTSDQISSKPTAEASLLEKFSDIPMIPVCRGDRCPAAEEKLNHTSYFTNGVSTETRCSSFDELIGGVGLLDLRPGEIMQMDFAFEDGVVCWGVWDGPNCCQIFAPLTHCYAYSKANGHTYAASARWRSFMVLEMEVRRVDAIGGVRLIFRFNEDGLTIEADDTVVSAGGLGISDRHTIPFRLL